MDFKKYKSVLIFLFIVMAIDILTMEQHLSSIFYRFDIFGILGRSIIQDSLEAAFHYGILLVALGIFCVWYCTIFAVRRPWVFFCISYIYIFSFGITRYPQIAYGTRWGNFLPTDVSILGLKTFLLVLVPIAVLVVVKSIKIVFCSSREISRKTQAILILSFILMLFWVNILALRESEIPVMSYEASYRAPKENIIVISIDGLNEDVEPIIRKFANRELIDFLNKSSLHKRVVADVPQTHGSFAAIFSGLPAYQNKVRYPFHSIYGSSNQDLFKTLREIKDRDYEITLIRDEMVTTPIFPGNVIDRVISPQMKQRSNFVGPFFSSFLVYGVFDNAIGRIFFPLAYDNSAFSYGNSFEKTLDSVNKFFSILTKSQKKEFVFFHSCAIHNPIRLPYPYYSEKAFVDVDEKRFSYPETFFKSYGNQHQARLQSAASYNREVYDSAVAMTTKKMLNPIFSRIKNDPSFKNSTIILMSDHGENLWDQHKYPLPHITTPFHGDTFLFGSKNEFSYFRYYRPFDKAIFTDRAINLSQVFRKALSLSYRNDLVYSENAYIPRKSSLSLPRFITYPALVHGYQRSSEFNYYFTDKDLIYPAVLQKQRAVFLENLKLVSYVTDFGRKLFLCDYQNDPFCENNILNNSSYMDTKRRLVRELASVIYLDSTIHLDVPLHNEKNETVQDLKDYLKSDNLWLKMYGATVLFNKYHDFDNALTILNEIFDKTDQPALKRYIAEFSLENCQYSTDKFQAGLERQARFIIEDRPAVRMTLTHSKFYFCGVEKAQTMNNNFGPDKMDWTFNSIVNLKEKYNFPDGESYLKNLEKKFSLTPSIKISEVFQKIPPGYNTTELREFLNFMKFRQRYYFNYELPKERDLYYFLKVVLSQNLGLDLSTELLQELTEYRGSAYFETLYFNTLERKYSLPPIPYSDLLTDRRELRLTRLKKVVYRK